MITPAIERALISGKARLATFLLNTTAVGLIKVPANCFIIITDVIAHPFSSIKANMDTVTPAQCDKRGTHVIEFTNQDTGRVGFIFRNTPIVYRDSVYELGSVGNSPAIKFDTYLVRDKDVYVQVGCVTGIAGAKSFSFVPLEPRTQNPPPPKGYGSIAPLIQQYVDESDDIYQQAEGATTIGNLPAGEQLYNQPLPNYLNSACRLEQPEQNVFSPCVTVQYVIVNEQVRKNFQ